MESTPKKETTQEPGVTLAEYLNDILVEEKVAQTILSKGNMGLCGKISQIIKMKRRNVHMKKDISVRLYLVA